MKSAFLATPSAIVGRHCYLPVFVSSAWHSKFLPEHPLVTGVTTPQGDARPNK